MIAAIPLNEAETFSTISSRFTRSNYFAILNSDLRKINIVQNPYSSKNKDAGLISLERLVSKYNVDTLIAFELGIKVQKAANQKKLQLILLDNRNKTLDDIKDLLKII